MSHIDNPPNPLAQMRNEGVQPDPWPQVWTTRMRSRSRRRPHPLIVAAAALVLAFLVVQGVFAWADGRLGETRIDDQRAAIEHCVVLAPSGSAEFDACVAEMTNP